MKVGTDGVLLGAWTPLRDSDRRILDIGTGTGLIALMLAQRAPGAAVTGIDIDDVGEARANGDASPWGDRLSFVRCPVQEFSDRPFDLIVSNPPFFVDSLTCPDAGRTTVRHAVHLPFVHGVAHLNEGRCAGRRRAVKRAYHRARDGRQGGLSSILSGSRGRRGCGCRRGRCLRHGRNGYRSGRLHDGACRNGRAVDDANVVFAFRDFKFGNAAFAHEVDQCLEFAKVHLFQQ